MCYENIAAFFAAEHTQKQAAKPTAEQTASCCTPLSQIRAEALHSNRIRKDAVHVRNLSTKVKLLGNYAGNCRNYVAPLFEMQKIKMRFAA